MISTRATYYKNASLFIEKSVVEITKLKFLENFLCMSNFKKPTKFFHYMRNLNIVIDRNGLAYMFDISD